MNIDKLNDTAKDWLCTGLVLVIGFVLGVAFVSTVVVLHEVSR